MLSCDWYVLVHRPNKTKGVVGPLDAFKVAKSYAEFIRDLSSVFNNEPSDTEVFCITKKGEYPFVTGEYFDDEEG